MKDQKKSQNYASAESLQFQMWKKQQSRKKRIKNNVPSLVARCFRRNEGTTDYAQFAAPITLTGDFEVDAYFTFNKNSNSKLMGHTLAGAAGLLGVDKDGKIVVRHSGEWIKLGIIPNLIHGVLYRITLIRTGGVISVNIGGVSAPLTTVYAGDWIISQLYRAYGGLGYERMSGILANLKIWDDGVLVTDCPIDEPSGATIIDHASGNNATIVNGLDVDRGKFNEQPTLWKGKNLSVPPWDSVDQELLKS